MGTCVRTQFFTTMKVFAVLAFVAAVSAFQAPASMLASRQAAVATSAKVVMAEQDQSRRSILTTLAAGASLAVSTAAKALIDDDVVPFLGGGEKFDVNNANIRVYTKLPGMYPTIAAKICANGPYKNAGDVYSSAGLTEAE